jgi:hypothetical protein
VIGSSVRSLCGAASAAHERVAKRLVGLLLERQHRRTHHRGDGGGGGNQQAARVVNTAAAARAICKMGASKDADAEKTSIDLCADMKDVYSACR